MKGILSNVDDTLNDSNGSLRKTKVMPLAFEKTRIINPERRISERVICKGMVRGADAANGHGEVNEGVVDR